MRSFISALFFVIVGLVGCSFGHPSLPEASKVKTIKVVGNSGKYTYLISPGHFSEVLALFRDGTRDTNPARWVVMGYDLEITTDDGRQIDIWLYKTFHEKGAFAIGPLGKHIYYRGATDQQIDETIKKASNPPRKED